MKPTHIQLDFFATRGAISCSESRERPVASPDEPHRGCGGAASAAITGRIAELGRSATVFSRDRYAAPSAKNSHLRFCSHALLRCRSVAALLPQNRCGSTRFCNEARKTRTGGRSAVLERAPTFADASYTRAPAPAGAMLSRLKHRELGPCPATPDAPTTPSHPRQR